MSVLTLYIKQENKKAKARMEAEEGLFIGLMSEDESWWAERDVYTVEQYERWGYEVIMSDLAKEAYGTRRMCPDTSNMSLDELKAEYNRMSDIASANFEAEKAAQLISVTEFEATIVKMIEAGAEDREAALNWLIGAEDVNEDISFFEYCNDVPYGYISGVRAGWLA